MVVTTNAATAEYKGGRHRNVEAVVTAGCKLKATTEQRSGRHRQQKTSSGCHRLHKEAVVTAVLTEKRLSPLSATEQVCGSHRVVCCVVLCICLEYHVQEDTQRLSHAQSLENVAPTQLASKTPQSSQMHATGNYAHFRLFIS